MPYGRSMTASTMVNTETATAIATESPTMAMPDALGCLRKSRSAKRRSCPVPSVRSSSGHVARLHTLMAESTRRLVCRQRVRQRDMPLARSRA